MLTIEIIAVVFSFLSVYYTIKQKIINWPLGLIGVAAYGYLFFNVNLYADFSLQIIFFVQGLYGWWFWRKNKEGVEPPIRKLPPASQITYVCLFIFTYATSYFILKTKTNSDVPAIDTLASIGSVFANWFLAKKYLSAWAIWIFVDVIYIGLFIYKGLYLSSCLYLVFLGMAIAGFIKWQTEYKSNQWSLKNE